MVFIMLSSWQISKKTFSWLIENKFDLLKVNLPLIFVFILMLFAKLMKSDLFLLLNFFQMWFFTVSIIQVHRKILLDNKKYQMLLFPKPEKTHFLYPSQFPFHISFQYLIVNLYNLFFSYMYFEIFI